MPRLAPRDRARIVFDCRTANDPAMMSSTNPVLHYVAGVLRAIVPPLVPWATCVLAGARITQPEDNDVVIVGKIPVSGTYRFECLSYFTTTATIIGRRAAPFWIAHGTHGRKMCTSAHRWTTNILYPSRRLQKMLARYSTIIIKSANLPGSGIPSFCTSSPTDLQFCILSECNRSGPNQYIQLTTPIFG
jgi:hypothetical protein